MEGGQKKEKQKILFKGDLWDALHAPAKYESSYDCLR